MSESTVLFCAVNFSAPQGKHDNCARCQSGGHGCRRRSFIARGLRLFLFPFCGIDGVAGYGFGYLGVPAGEHIALACGGCCSVALAAEGGSGIAGKQVFINLIFKNRALCAVFINNGEFIFILVGDAVVVSVRFPCCGIDCIFGYGFGYLGIPAGEHIARSRWVLAEGQ